MNEERDDTFFEEEEETEEAEPSEALSQLVIADMSDLPAEPIDPYAASTITLTLKFLSDTGSGNREIIAMAVQEGGIILSDVFYQSELGQLPEPIELLLAKLKARIAASGQAAATPESGLKVQPVKVMAKPAPKASKAGKPISLFDM